MHTKIITQKNDPNFLTHVIWSKSSLGVQHIHLALSRNLSYAFSKKIKHNSRIINSGDYKIVVTSPEVCFVIKRQYTKVDCKDLIIFIYKNQLFRSWRNGKTFL
jgi:hypothetical protein